MNILDQYLQGEFVTMEYIENKYKGLPPQAHIIIWRRENERMQKEQDAYVEYKRTDRLLEATYVKLDTMTITDRFGLDDSDLQETN